MLKTKKKQKRAAGGFALAMEQTELWQLSSAASWAGGLTHLRPLCRRAFQHIRGLFGLNDVTERHLRPLRARTAVQTAKMVECF